MVSSSAVRGKPQALSTVGEGQRQRSAGHRFHGEFIKSYISIDLIIIRGCYTR